MARSIIIIGFYILAFILPSVTQNEKTVHVIRIDGTINPAVASMITASIETAAREERSELLDHPDQYPGRFIDLDPCYCERYSGK
jgi:membrane-bound ClpP family serine protease